MFQFFHVVISAPTGGRADQEGPLPRGTDTDGEKIPLSSEPAGGNQDTAGERRQAEVGTRFGLVYVSSKYRVWKGSKPNKLLL